MANSDKIIIELKYPRGFSGRGFSGRGFSGNNNDKTSSKDTSVGKLKMTSAKTLLKSVPYLGQVISVLEVAEFSAKLVANAIEVVVPYVEGYTGNPTLGLNISNFKKGLSMVSNPIGYALNTAKENMRAELWRQKVNQQRKLTGNSIINTYGGTKGAN